MHELRVRVEFRIEVAAQARKDRLITDFENKRKKRRRVVGLDAIFSPPCDAARTRPCVPENATHTLSRDLSPAHLICDRAIRSDASPILDTCVVYTTARRSILTVRIRRFVRLASKYTESATTRYPH